MKTKHVVSAEKLAAKKLARVTRLINMGDDLRETIPSGWESTAQLARIRNKQLAILDKLDHLAAPFRERALITTPTAGPARHRY